MFLILKRFYIKLVGILKVNSDIEVTRRFDGSIHLHGYKDDVAEIRETLNKLIISHCEEKSKNLKKLIKSSANNIQWEYETQSSTWVPFDPYSNVHIEEGFEHKKIIVYKSIWFLRFKLSN